MTEQIRTWPDGLFYVSSTGSANALEQFTKLQQASKLLRALSDASTVDTNGDKLQDILTGLSLGNLSQRHKYRVLYDTVNDRFVIQRNSGTDAAKSWAELFRIDASGNVTTAGALSADALTTTAGGVTLGGNLDANGFYLRNVDKNTGEFRTDSLLVHGAATFDGDVTIGDVSATEISYLDGTLAAIQSQFPRIAGGRLTLTSSVAVTSSDVSSATTVYYTPYLCNQIALYDGTTWQVHTFSELSQATTDTLKSPVAVTANNNYDMFVWNDSGTLRCTRGPAWTSGVSRGTGAGTTELELVDGVYVNKVAITKGPDAQRGRYVGTIRSDGSFTINDTLRLRMVWNMYNRAPRPMRRFEQTSTWNYTTASYRQANGSTLNSLDFVRGLDVDTARCLLQTLALNSTSTARLVLSTIGLDSTSGPSTASTVGRSTITDAIGQSTMSMYEGFPGLGFHQLTWLEAGGGSDATAWFGSALTVQQGMTGTVWG